MNATIKIIKSRTNEQLIKDWAELDNQIVTQEVADVRGWMMKEIEKRWPVEFDAWMDSEDPDDDINKFIKL